MDDFIGIFDDALMAGVVRRHLAQYVDRYRALVQAMYRCGPINLQKYLRASGGYHRKTPVAGPCTGCCCSSST